MQSQSHSFGATCDSYWNLDWIKKQYGMFPKPLPDNWQKYTRQADETVFESQVTIPNTK
jgi:hypothetical protein